MSTRAGIYPRFRPDGGELYYLSPDETLMAVPLTWRSGVNAPHDGGVASAPLAGAPVRLFHVHLASGAWVASTGFDARPQYDVATDGRFLMNLAVEAEARRSPSC